MQHETPEFSAVLARLDKLEKQNRRLKRLALLCLLIAGSGFLLAQVPRKALSAAPTQAVQAATYDTLVVHRLELRDKAGKLRGLWTVEAEAPFLELYDTAGKPRARLGVVLKFPAVMLYDAAGKLRAGLQVDDSGPGLHLYDAALNTRARLGVDDDGPSLWLQDAQQFQAVVGVTGLETIGTGESHKTSAAAVTLFGKDGKVIWRAP
ncbi:MAG: hypothetical protein MUP80_09950 [Acidobacteriia bacterium]|nr:hypothetical protein [Terriglobia bacterium]